MKVLDFFKNFSDCEIIGNGECEFHSIESNSREVKPGALFVALKGEAVDGHVFIKDAIERGAAAVVCEVIPPGEFPNIVWIRFLNTKKIFPRIVKKFYGDPAGSLKLIGITGTNGKTTTAFLIEHIFSLKTDSLLVGTVEHRLAHRRIVSNNTTPGILEITELMKEAVGVGAEYGIFEVSSHALKQKRLSGLKFETALFTNLTQDHLDYHMTFEDYFSSKKALFTDHSPKTSVVNRDNFYGMQLINELRVLGSPVVTYSIKEKSDSWASDIALGLEGVSFLWHYENKEYQVNSRLVGRHNVSNIVAALTVAVLNGFTPGEAILRVQSFEGVPGRMERVGENVFIDYAHTPDAVLNVLSSVREVLPKEKGKMIVVFGCGGDRDTSKRPLMAKAAEKYSDSIVITSDNPRSENPEKILDDIAAGIEGKFVRIENRDLAIGKAVGMAGPQDVVLILGKGHEDYQLVGTEKKYFSDTKVAAKWLAAKKSTVGSEL